MRRVVIGLLLLASAALARAEVVVTKDGQRLQGELLEESPDEVVVRTRWGVLVVARDAIASIEGRPAASTAPVASAAEPAIDIEKVTGLHLRARRSAQRGDTQMARKLLEEVLTLDPADAPALLELSALAAQDGKTALAVSTLRRAILAGLADLEQLRRDGRFQPVRDDAAWKQLMDQRVGLLRLAARRAPAQLTRYLRSRGARAEYRAVPDEARQLVWLHGLDPDVFPRARAEVEAIVDAARGEVFTSPPVPLIIVLLHEQDRRVLNVQETALFEPHRQLLLLARFPLGTLARAPEARRMLAYALHATDRQARLERHAPWLEVALAETLAASELRDGRLAPRPVPVDDRVVAAAPALGDLLRADRAAVGAKREVALGLRALLQHLAARDGLRALYEGAAKDVVAGGDGRAVVEAAGGGSIASVVSSLGAALRSQPAAAVPFAGFTGGATPRGLRVSYVQADSGAARAGLVEADVVVTVDGAAVRADADLRELLAERAPGEEIELELLRGEELQRVRLMLGAPQSGPIGPLRDRAPYLGVAVEQAGSAVAISALDASSPAARAGLQVGDRLVTLDGAEVATVRAWLRALRGKKPGEPCALVVLRAGARVEVTVTLEALPG